MKMQSVNGCIFLIYSNMEIIRENKNIVTTFKVENGYKTTIQFDVLENKIVVYNHIKL